MERVLNHTELDVAEVAQDLIKRGPGERKTKLGSHCSACHCIDRVDFSTRNISHP
jgi:hypothetical protein